jgi:hypothetical protein
MRVYSFSTSKTIFLILSLAALAAAPAVANDHLVCEKEIAAADQPPPPTPEPRPHPNVPGALVCPPRVTQWKDAQCKPSTEASHFCRREDVKEQKNELWTFKLVIDPVQGAYCVPLPDAITGRPHHPDGNRANWITVKKCNWRSTIVTETTSAEPMTATASPEPMTESSSPEQ